MLIHVNLFSQTDNEFWFAAPEISYQFSSASGVTSNHRDRPIQLVLTCFDQRAHVTICQPANLNFPIIHKIVPADTFLIVDLTPYIDIIENKPADSVLPYGLLITSDNPITANYEITHYSTPYGNGAMYVLKGKNALGYDFIIPSQTLYPNFPYCDPPARNCFDIVAVEDSTQITITPSSIITGHPAGVPFNITLNRGKVGTEEL